MKRNKKAKMTVYSSLNWKAVSRSSIWWSILIIFSEYDSILENWPTQCAAYYIHKLGQSPEGNFKNSTNMPRGIACSIFFVASSYCSTEVCYRL